MAGNFKKAGIEKLEETGKLEEKAEIKSIQQSKAIPQTYGDVFPGCDVIFFNGPHTCPNNFPSALI